MTKVKYIWKNGLLGVIESYTHSNTVVVEYEQEPKPKVNFHIKTTDNNGNILSMLASVIESLLRGWYSTTVYKRFSVDGEELIDVDKLMEQVTCKNIPFYFETHFAFPQMMEGTHSGDIPKSIPDLALQNQKRIDLKTDLTMGEVIGAGSFVSSRSRTLFLIFLCVGSFGVVSLAKMNDSGETVVVKRMTQNLTDDPVSIFSQFVTELWMMTLISFLKFIIENQN